MKENGRHFAIVAGLMVVVGIAAYVLLDTIYQLPTAASAQAGPIDTLFRAHFIVIAVLFSLIVVFMGYSLFVFRRKPGEEDASGAQFHGHTGLEIAWTIVPLVAVISFGVWGAFTLNDVTSGSSDEMAVDVRGRQWSWVFSYPDYEDIGVVTELLLPVDKPVLLRMNSDDVLHSFWVPEFRVKQDLVPGKETYLRITPTKIGSYKVRCAEICGTDHANMRADIRVVSQSEFDAWVSDQVFSVADATALERGKRWSEVYGCGACHSIDGSQKTGPTWQGLFGREESLSDGTTVTVDEAYLRESIEDPAARIVAGFENVAMPNFIERFAADEAALLDDSGVAIDIVADLIAYIESLSEQ